MRDGLGALVIDVRNHDLRAAFAGAERDRAPNPLAPPVTRSRTVRPKLV